MLAQTKITTWLATVLLCAICLAGMSAIGDDWPQWRGIDRDGRWHETGIIESLPKGQLPLMWKVPIGPGYSGPTVAGGLVYVTDRNTEGGKEQERILCFDAETGKPVWKVEYDAPYDGIGYPAGPRASVSIDHGKAYALGSAGNLHCCDAKTGDVIWQRDLRKDYRIEMPIWGVSASPLVVGDQIIAQISGADGACIVSLDTASGKEKWKALKEPGQYSAPILIKQGSEQVVVVWTGASVSGLKLEDGNILWTVPWKPKNMPIGCATPVVSGDTLFFTSFYDGSLMLRFDRNEPKVETLWKIVGPSENNTDALQSIISTPIVREGYVYGVDSYGELRCLDAKTGHRLWENLTATPKSRWSTIHFVEQGDRDWLFNERGELLIGKLSPSGFEEFSRAKVIEPTTDQLRQRGGVCWSHPAFAMKSIFARNDKGLVRASLKAEK